MYVQIRERLMYWVKLFVVFLAHVAVVFLIISKRVTNISLAYENQRLCKKYQELMKERQFLQEQLCQIQDKAKVREFAQKELGMQRMKLSQTSRLTQ